ncbi:MopE-related protein [Pyxidicoccus xibeiensis]|uniref:MopE-related protein n=1 Tax=Pyxidicoccus xibeiensis TaxID=2906759 RepID=UPI0020A79A80|nr:MopE-related protein [Pyxidicoccus xibeiensis]MCP3138143.1 hypothetical protein [Pyxidicoccus xibeiensis]
MRLFLVGALLLVVSNAGCRKEAAPPSAGALRVLIAYATFQPRCLTLTVVDQEDPARTDSVEVRVEPGVRSDTRTVAVLGREGWSRNLKLTAAAFERSCSGARVAEQSLEVQVPTEGVSEARMSLRAEDLDNDMYVAATGPLPGTDCDDANEAVHPNAAEPCDGLDNNCVAGESDAAGTRDWYEDRDGDGYGNASAPPIPYCVPPSNFAARAGDCNDGEATIRPDQAESRCDGVDEDCDGTADDDDFAVGATCATPLGCPGVKTCQGVSSAVCSSPQQPEPAWYVDEDGDLQAGTDVGPGCTAPVPGATTVRTDCDESSRFAAGDAPEVCDRLDNDCDGQTDELLVTCGLTPWRTDPGVGAADATWNAVAPYPGNRGWLAGTEGRVVHVDGTDFAPVTDCPGTWEAAWATASGRVFLGSSAGVFATVAPGALATCEQVNGPGSSSLNGLVGFERGTSVALFAVDSQGRVIRWDYVEGAPTQAAPRLVTQVAANLRAIHGVGPEVLLAVGAETVDGVARPVAWGTPGSGSTWLKEDLGLAEATGFLRGVQVLTPRLAYVAGDDGLLLERAGGSWSAKPRLTLPGGTPDVRALLAFGRTALYALSSDVSDIHFFDGTAWRSVTAPPRTLEALGGTGPGDVWGAGAGGTLVRWRH